MSTWIARYTFSDVKGSTKIVKFYVSAPTAGDVTDLIRKEIDWSEHITVDEVTIKRLDGRGIICAKHLDGSLQLKGLNIDA